MDENELGMNVGYETDYKKQKSFSITREECEQVEKEYEINDIIVNLNKALSKVGNVTILEALEQLKKQTRFADELEYRGKYIPIENTPLINDVSEIGMGEKITD